MNGWVQREDYSSSKYTFSVEGMEFNGNEVDLK